MMANVHHCGARASSEWFGKEDHVFFPLDKISRADFTVSGSGEVKPTVYHGYREAQDDLLNGFFPVQQRIPYDRLRIVGNDNNLRDKGSDSRQPYPNRLGRSLELQYERMIDLAGHLGAGALQTAEPTRSEVNGGAESGVRYGAVGALSLTNLHLPKREVGGWPHGLDVIAAMYYRKLLEQPVAGPTFSGMLPVEVQAAVIGITDHLQIIGTQIEPYGSITPQP